MRLLLVAVIFIICAVIAALCREAEEENTGLEPHFVGWSVAIVAALSVALLFVP